MPRYTLAPRISPVGEGVADAGIGVPDERVHVVVGEGLTAHADGEHLEAEGLVPVEDALLHRPDDVVLRVLRLRVVDLVRDDPVDGLHARLDVPLGRDLRGLAGVGHQAQVAAEEVLAGRELARGEARAFLVTAERDAQRARGAVLVVLAELPGVLVGRVAHAGEDLLVGDAVGEHAGRCMYERSTLY
jgi:hypothetical protein